MIRPIQPQDTPALLALAEATGLFDAASSQELRQLLADYFSGDIHKNHFWITDDTQGLIGVAYYAPERMTEGTWNLYLIAIHPDHQGKGRGTALLGYVEHALRERGERLLLVETSGLNSFERTRTFYRKCGYEEEARVRDFYTTGEDKIVYRKLLNPQGETALRVDATTASNSETGWERED
jgi:ribosomal protein S18 acetylase RimI-like enzyme